MNRNFENSNLKTKKSKQRTLFKKIMLNFFSITRKRKIKRIQRDQRVTIDLTNKNDENYRCIFCDNTLKLIKKFNFGTAKNFVKLITKNED